MVLHIFKTYRIVKVLPRMHQKYSTPIFIVHLDLDFVSKYTIMSLERVLESW